MSEYEYEMIITLLLGVLTGLVIMGILNGKDGMNDD
jgi:hypothetical protein